MYCEVNRVSMEVPKGFSDAPYYRPGTTSHGPLFHPTLLQYDRRSSCTSQIQSTCTSPSISEQSVVTIYTKFGIMCKKLPSFPVIKRSQKKDTELTKKVPFLVVHRTSFVPGISNYWNFHPKSGEPRDPPVHGNRVTWSRKSRRFIYVLLMGYIHTTHN